MNNILRGYDIDGTLTTGIKPQEPYVIISGRVFAEYNDYVKQLANKAPVYIRGSGKYGDRIHAGTFKSNMINILGVQEFYEDDDVQINIIQQGSPNCKVIKVFPDGTTKYF